MDNLEASRELDALVAELMGKPFRKPTHGSCCTCQVCGWDYDNCQCGYGEFIDKAWQVVEKMQEIGHTVTMFSSFGEWVCQLGTTKKITWETEVVANTAPLAICLAALKAKGVE